MAGMTANHHRLVRQKTSATAVSATPMMISVLPMWDQIAVTESQVWVRVSCSDRFRSLSEWSQLLSGPVNSLPNALIASHRTNAGARASRKHVADGGSRVRACAPRQVRGNKEHVSSPFLSCRFGLPQGAIGARYRLIDVIGHRWVGFT